MILHVLLATPLRVEFFLLPRLCWTCWSVPLACVGLKWLLSRTITLSPKSLQDTSLVGAILTACLSPVWGIVGMSGGPINGSILLTLVLLDVV